MAIDFVIRINKLIAPRIVVLKAVLNENGRVSKFNTLGSLKGLDAASLKTFSQEKQLDEYEQFQLENYVASLKFNQQEFKASADTLQSEKFIYSTPGYNTAIFELWKLARKHNIIFNPIEVQQKALLHKAKAVERELNEKLETPIKLLENLGIDIRRYDRDDIKKRPDKTGQQLFNLIDKIKRPSADILCQNFNDLAKKHYGKNVNLKPHYLKDYAKNKRYPLWYCTVAIDLLLQHNIDLMKHFDPTKIVGHWLRLRKNHYGLDEAYKVFKTTFKPNKEDEAKIKEAIQQEYEQGISTANA